VHAEQAGRVWDASTTAWITPGTRRRAATPTAQSGEQSPADISPTARPVVPVPSAPSPLLVWDELGQRWVEITPEMLRARPAWEAWQLRDPDLIEARWHAFKEHRQQAAGIWDYSDSGWASLTVDDASQRSGTTALPATHVPLPVVDSTVAPDATPSPAPPPTLSPSPSGSLADAGGAPPPELNSNENAPGPVTAENAVVEEDTSFEEEDLVADPPDAEVSDSDAKVSDSSPTPLDAIAEKDGRVSPPPSTSALPQQERTMSPPEPIILDGKRVVIPSFVWESSGMEEPLSAIIVGSAEEEVGQAARWVKVYDGQNPEGRLMWFHDLSLMEWIADGSAPGGLSTMLTPGSNASAVE